MTLFYSIIYACCFWIIVGKDVIFLKNPLVSRKLCGNDRKDGLSMNCFNSNYTSIVNCDSRKVSECIEVTVKYKAVKESAFDSLSRLDKDTTIRRIIIDLRSATHVNYSLLGSMVDQFLLPRPSWTVVNEPFKVGDRQMVVLERYSQLWDSYFEYLASLQFPSVERCSSSMMLIGRLNLVDPGYSDVRMTYFNEVKYSPIPTAIHVDLLSTQGENAGFISEKDCPVDQKNRWTCAFLQLTNCSLPLGINNRTNNYKPMDLYHSNINGGRVNHKVQENFVEQMTQKNTLAVKKIQRMIDSLPPFVYIAPYTQSASMLKFHGPDEHRVPEFLFNEFLFRRNYFYRRKVAEVLAGFRAKYGLGDAIRTKNRRFVAVHIRRSDRLLEGVNMTDFCQHILIQKVTGVTQNCTYPGGEVKTCYEDGSSLGCDNFGDIPVGAVTLDTVIPPAELLVGPSIRNMMVFSDDVDWLEGEIRRVKSHYPKWKFFTLDAPREKEKGATPFSTRTSGTDAGVFYQATLDLVRECDAILGHFTSAVPMTFAGAMCHHHAGMEGICPPVYNLKNKL